MNVLHHNPLMNDYQTIDINELEYFLNIQDEMYLDFDITSHELGINELIDCFELEEF